jgi:hypothetical protein
MNRDMISRATSGLDTPAMLPVLKQLLAASDAGLGFDGRAGMWLALNGRAIEPERIRTLARRDLVIIKDGRVRLSDSGVVTARELLARATANAIDVDRVPEAGA